MVLVLIFIYSLICSFGVIVLAGFFLLIPENIRLGHSGNLLSYSMGILLGQALLGFLPYALSSAPESEIFICVMFGLILFFIFEKILINKFEVNRISTGIIEKSVGSNILIGDSFQNLVNGIIIAGTFFQSIYLGIFTSLTIIAYQIPQKVVNFTILLESGYSRKKAFVYNSIASSNTVTGAIFAFVYLDRFEKMIPYLLSFAAASFIYISIGEIAPKLNKIEASLLGGHNKYKVIKEDLKKLIFILLGIGTIFILEKYH